MKRKPAFLTLLAVILAVLAFLLLHRRPSVPPPIVLRPTARQAAQAQSHLATLRQQLQPEAPQQGPPKPRTLRLSEEDLDVTLAENNVARSLLIRGGVKAVQIILSEPANVTVRAAVLLHGHPQNIEIDGSLAPDPKMGLRFTAARAQVGRLPLPPAAVSAQADALAARLVGRTHGRLPLTVQSVQVQGKTLVLTGLPVERIRVKPPVPASPR